MAKKCKICLQPFTPQFSSFQKTCNNTECLVDFGRQESSKLHKKAARLEKKKARDNDKQHWLKRVQIEFNKFIRNRDSANACIGSLHERWWSFRSAKVQRRQLPQTVLSLQ
jgi:hypothetical protein